MKRRLAVTAGAGGVALMVLALIPWWAAWVLPVIARHYGATYARYERISYRRFALVDTTVRRGAVIVRVSRAEADTPLLWAWRHWRGRPTLITASTWSVEVAKRASPPPAGPSGWVPLRARLQRIAAGLDRWLPLAEVGSGQVRWPGSALAIGRARWENGTLHVTALRWRDLQADATLAFRAADRITLNAGNAAGWRADLTSQAERVTGTLQGEGQPVRVAAAFPSEGWRPRTAEADADPLRVPAETLKLGPGYEVVTGRVHVGWHDDRFDAQVLAAATPRSGASVPPLRIEARGQGGMEAFTVEALHLSIPGVVADLSAPVTITRSGQIRGAGARLSLRADLAQQRWWSGRGLLTGEAHVVAAPGAAMPRVEFTLSAEQLAWDRVKLRAASAAGRLVWPALQLEQVTARGDGGDVVEAHGAWDFRRRELEAAQVHADISAAALQPWLPPGLALDRLTADVGAHGPLHALQCEGTGRATALALGALRPAAVTAHWTGNSAARIAFEVDADFGAAALACSGVGDAHGLELQSATLRERAASAPALGLRAPVRVSWAPGLAIGTVHLAGPDAALDGALAWGRAGHVDLAVRGITSRLVDALYPLRGPAWTLSSLALRAAWDGGPATYTSAGGVQFSLGGGRLGAVNWSLHGNPDGLVVDALHGTESGHAVVNATGGVPIRFAPATPTPVAVDPQGALRLEASTVPNAAFWAQLAEATGLELRAPQMVAHLTGTWTEPLGEVTFRAERAGMDPKRFARPLPLIEAIDIAVHGDAGGVRLDRFWFTIEHQVVRASGRLPVGRDTWGELGHDPVGYLQRGAQVRLEVPDAEVAMFSRFLPAALAPAGRLQADVRFDRGLLAGYLRLRDAASRPLGPLGVLQQVSADVEFTDHRVNLRQVTALSGGQPVTLSGTVELPTSAWLSGRPTEPTYAVTLQGKNLPFVRQAGLLVRGDVQLKLTTPASGPPGLSGQVVLRDSLFLTDVRAFLPHGGAASPARRPPYFSVDTAPMNTWALDVDVSGSRFMRVRTPVFVGVASTHFHLGGTLGEPRALGDATIDEGQVLMPFSAFAVRQGAVRLTEESPYEPTIYLRGTGRHYGYDLTMEVSGKASAPDITFTSSPALDSEQVLLMVMTGAAPSNEVNASLTDRAVRLGTFFGQSLVGTLTGGAAEPDRLSIESGEKISRQGKQTYDIEYKLNHRWTLTGEYDEFDEYNVGFKWRVSPKPPAR